MKPAAFTYHDPATLAEATDLLGRLEEVRLLAGGQSLMPMMNFRFVQPDHLIDLNRVGGLDGVAVEKDRIVVGAMTRQCALQRSDEIRRAMPILPAGLAHVGHRQTRARGTIGGSLCHFDPSAELCNMAALHDAELVLASRDGDRVLGMEAFGLGYLTTAVAPGELLREVRLRIWPTPHGYGFEEFAMRHGDFAVCAVSCLVTLDPSGVIDEFAIAVSGLAEMPVRLRDTEAGIRGQTPGPDLFRAIAERAAAIEAMSDAYVTADYRRHLARVLTVRAVSSAVERAGSRIVA